jgi:hypothetical protein
MSESEETENEELIEDFEDAEEEIEEEVLDEEFIGEDEWGDEEEDAEEEAEEEALPTFVDNSDGTVTETKRSLQWIKKDSFAEYKYGITWFEAHDYCEKMNEENFAGFDDWRLCGSEEAKGLFSFVRTNHDKDGAEIHIDSEFEPNGGHNTWTYDEKPDYPQYAMKFSYVTGNWVWEAKDNEYSHCRLVRDVVRDEWEPEWRTDSKKFAR